MERPRADAAAIRHLHQTHAPVLLRFLTRLLNGDVQRAEDCLQETLLRAWRNPEAQTHNGRWSRAWLFTVARHIAIDSIRAREARVPEASGERIDRHAARNDAIQQLLDAHEVHEALTSLPEHFRTTLVEIYFRERSVAETADILKVPIGTVKSRTFYGLQALREALAARRRPDGC
nr:sigma-70 family RNA polymerase sigma factor [Actinoplanes sp. N902-109]